MSAGAAVGGGAAAAAAIAQAIKASGVLVRVEPREFQKLLDRNADGVVVHAEGGWWKVSHRYLTSYKGLAFFTTAPRALPLPGGCEVVEARNIWTPA